MQRLRGMAVIDGSNTLPEKGQSLVFYLSFPCDDSDYLLPVRW